MSVTRYNLYTAAAVTGNVPAGRELRGGHRRRGPRWPRETLPRAMTTEWTELMFLQIRAGNTAIYVFLLAVVFVFLALAALYESWALPLAVILVVPLCLLCSVGGVLLTRQVGGHLRADRAGGAGRAGVQERHPDRRVRRVLHREGKPRHEAAVEASRLRLRPILMTSLRVHPRGGAAGGRDRGRGGDAAEPGHRRCSAGCSG